MEECCLSFAHQFTLAFSYYPGLSVEDSAIHSERSSPPSVTVQHGHGSSDLNNFPMEMLLDDSKLCQVDSWYWLGHLHDAHLNVYTHMCMCIHVHAHRHISRTCTWTYTYMHMNTYLMHVHEHTIQVHNYMYVYRYSRLHTHVLTHANSQVHYPYAPHVYNHGTQENQIQTHSCWGSTYMGGKMWVGER